MAATKRLSYKPANRQDRSEQGQWVSNAASSACRTSASPRSSTRSPRRAAAQAANYPFCTIEPNVGDVAVPEPRLDALAAIAKSKEIIPTRINFVDIAGLVRGASKGEGLGNQFLANIRDCDAVAFVARCFVDDDITHVEGRIDPLADLEIIETELMLADLESLEKRVVALEKKAKRRRQGSAGSAAPDRALRSSCCNAGKPARAASASRRRSAGFAELQLLTSKPALYVCNVEEARPPRATSFPTTVEAARRGRGRRRRSSSRPRSRARSPVLDADERTSSWRPWASTSPA